MENQNIPGQNAAPARVGKLCCLCEWPLRNKLRRVELWQRMGQCMKCHAKTAVAIVEVLNEPGRVQG